MDEDTPATGGRRARLKQCKDYTSAASSAPNSKKKDRPSHGSQGQTVTWLARQVPCSRTNIYKIFDRPSIDTDMLARLSDIMGFDFFAALSDGLNRGK